MLYYRGLNECGGNSLVEMVKHFRKKIFLISSFAVFALLPDVASAWIVDLAEGPAVAEASIVGDAAGQNSYVLGADLRLDDPETRYGVYEGWIASSMPAAINTPMAGGGAGRPGREASDTSFRQFIEFEYIDLVGVDHAAYGRTILVDSIETRARFEMPLAGGRKWVDMQPMDATGNPLTWGTIRRVKTWIRGSGAVVSIAQRTLVAAVSEPATLLLLAGGLLSLVVLRRRRVSIGR